MNSQKSRASTMGTKEPVDGTRKRNRRLIRGILSSFLSRGVAALVPLALIPMLLPVLGPATYGAWMTVVSIVGMLIWADLGLGNGLLTRLSRHLSAGDVTAARKDIFATYSILTLVATILVVLVSVSPLIINWELILNTEGSDAEAVIQIVLICLLCFFINVPISLIQRILFASQMVTISNAFAAAGSVLSLILAFLAINMNLSPAWIVLGATAGPLVANIGATIWFFVRNRSLIPSFADNSASSRQAILSLGGIFVLLSLSSAIASNSDSLIIAQTMGAENVASFAVSSRILGALGLIINLVNLPLWPVAADALARRDFAWVRKAVFRMTLLSGGFVLVSTVIITAISDPLIELIGQGMVHAELPLVMSLGVWWTVVALASPMMMVQNSAGVLLPQLCGWVLFLLVSVPVKILLIPSIGTFAGPMVGALVYVLFVIPFSIWGYRRATDITKRT